MKLDDIKKLILTLPDKLNHRSTTSHKFKNFLVDTFYGSTGNVLEVGCHMGHTSLILSKLFNKVYAMNNNPPDSNWICYGVENVIHECLDSYKDDWKWEEWKNVEVVFIDCVHDYKHVKEDTMNALKLPNVKCIVYDDYGASSFSEVKRAVDEMVDDKRKDGTLIEQIKFGITGGIPGLAFQEPEGCLVRFK